MAYKLIASDLDGTLLNNDSLISRRTREAIKDAQARGVIFTLATGRMYRSAIPFALELDLDTPLITYEGALVKTAKSKEVIYHRPLHVELAQEIISFGSRQNINMNVYLDDELFTHRETKEIREYSRVIQVPYTQVNNWQATLKEDPNKVLYMGEPELLDYLWEETKERFGKEVYITKSGPYFLEFTHLEATKGNGVRALAESLGIKKEEIMAFGDNFNDIELLKAAGMAVAMENGREELKKIATYVTGENHEDGVAQAIEKFVLSPN